MNYLQTIIDSNPLFRAFGKSGAKFSFLIFRRKFIKLSVSIFYIRSKAWAYWVKSKIVDIPNFDFMFFR